MRYKHRRMIFTMRRRPCSGERNVVRGSSVPPYIISKITLGTASERRRGKSVIRNLCSYQFLPTSRNTNTLRSPGSKTRVTVTELLHAKPRHRMGNDGSHNTAKRSTAQARAVSMTRLRCPGLQSPFRPSICLTILVTPPSSRDLFCGVV